jgi:Fe-S-cluster-containing hydrogenase component 2
MARIVFTGKDCTGCTICSLACAYAHDHEFNPAYGRIWVVKRQPATDYPVVCMQCAKPPCLNACRVGAITKREDGLVVVDAARCIGCGACVEACPFGAITVVNGKAVKCDLCGGDPACVKQCMPEALKLATPAQVAAGKR